MPEIAFIMGKSASGKDNIFSNIIQDKDLKLNTVVTYTTRPMRAGETDGKEYYFVSEDIAEDMQKLNKVIEMRKYNTVHGVWTYFTADDGQIELSGEKKYAVIGTLEAYEEFCKYFGKEHILPIYIEVEDGIRLSRALEREKKQDNPRYEELCRRFLADQKDFSAEKLFKAEINRTFYNNGELKDCIEEVKSEIKKAMKITV